MTYDSSKSLATLQGLRYKRSVYCWMENCFGNWIVRDIIVISEDMSYLTCMKAMECHTEEGIKPAEIEYMHRSPCLVFIHRFNHIVLCWDSIQSQSITLGYPLRCTERPSPSWWLQMSWRQIGTRPSATTMVSLLWLHTTIIHIVHIPLHISYHNHQTLTHWGRDKMDAIFQTTFSKGFSWMKMNEFRLRFHWNLFLRFELTIFQHWFR